MNLTAFTLTFAVLCTVVLVMGKVSIATVLIAIAVLALLNLGLAVSEW